MASSLPHFEPPDFGDVDSAAIDFISHAYHDANQLAERVNHFGDSQYKFLFLANLEQALMWFTRAVLSAHSTSQPKE